MDEQRELKDYQRRQNELKEKELEERLENERKGPGIRRTNSNSNSSKNSQLKLLAGAVKRKGELEPSVAKKLKDSAAEDTEIPKVVNSSGNSIGLLGLADYGSDSDSES